jgi:hypothetical protein
MAVEQLNHQAASPKPAVATARFPKYDLSTCAAVARTIHVKGGGQATPDQLAAHLGYKGTNNGAYLSKVAAAGYFGLIARNGPVIVPTTLAHQILSPVYAHDAKKALVDAFLNVEMFKRIYEDFKGKELPPEFGMKNALRNIYGVPAATVNDAYRSLMDSADTAGFFATKAGARTHLIMPLVQPVPGFQTGSIKSDPGELIETFGGGSGGGGNPPQPPGPTIPALQPFAGVASTNAKDSYINLLVRVLEKKIESGEPDEKLMERIERLLGLDGK